MRFEVKTDRSRNDYLSEFSHVTVNERYLADGERDVQDALARASSAYADNQEHAQRLYEYASKLWFGFSSPILANGGTDRGLPISCYLNHVDDSREGIFAHYTENGWLASNGGGIGGNWSALRSSGVATSRGSASGGSIPFIKVVDSLMLATNQGRTRRGSYAAYQDISHPEIEEFLDLRKPSGGDTNRRALNLHHGVNITDAFMRCVEDDSLWDLIDPHTGKVTKTVKARSLWQKIINNRILTGEPYLHFIDASNRALPDPLRRAGLEIRQSNLCSEIVLPTDEDYTAVCCLSSVNAEKFDEWKDDPYFLEDLARMLDNVLDAFIEKAPEELWRAKRSAKFERSIGLGCMGLHARFQSLGIPFESEAASYENARIFSHIEEGMTEASKKLARLRGEAPAMLGTGLRFSHKTAIAPNATSSIICGNTSPSIEPRTANAYLHKTLSGSFMVRNPILESRLEEIGMNTQEVWLSIVANEGSVQHLDFLSDHEKAVFKCAKEIDMNWVVRLAAERQLFIDQSQSVNLFFPRGVSARVVNEVHFLAWKMGLKSLYYFRSETESRVKAVSVKTERNLIRTPPPSEECLACEG
ncbi:ribonucleoside-diphosphate reductase subunit alpha [Candidatus Macondimonas diazotrophica]|jgi:ribonucleoside-diphosphate reductase alpha chain|uniref:Ribonucleoside-diphosphate reductase n=1 Tax=Candidatus Macondimonas diazotrophica TaxID=2305248 RepID=A0A4Z0F5Z4_9GAMM|nr:ribonucleoside-diphosphate reductase subunit alpha [Candidatus Macondimonas diazotrophica]TFZ81650.1 ribonucleoside-diphosphate reductase subunit alpha [Candidatus Macondimonas diazotrophica]